MDVLDRACIAAKLTKLRGDEPREKVAFACNISVSALGMYETGKRIPRDEVKVRLARYFQTTVEDLFFSQTSQNVSALEAVSGQE